MTINIKEHLVIKNNQPCNPIFFNVIHNYILTMNYILKITKTISSKLTISVSLINKTLLIKIL